jgi:hypothetical protein
MVVIESNMMLKDCNGANGDGGHSTFNHGLYTSRGLMVRRIWKINGQAEDLRTAESVHLNRMARRTARKKR